MSSIANRFQGCILGLALGDAMGAPFEGGVAERLLWRLIGRTRDGKMRWTDDTQMTFDIVQSLIARGDIDQDDLAKRFAASYRWSRGYGPATSRVLKRVSRGVPWEIASTSVYRGGSFGNGAAMRAPAVGLFFANRPLALDDAARRSAVVTHAHPLGIEGALLIARATTAALRGDSPSTILDFAAASCQLPPMLTRLTTAREWIATGNTPSTPAVKKHLGNGIAAAESCVTALYLALRFHGAPFVELQRFVATLGGDADTIGAMAGAIWGTLNGAGALPSEALNRLEQREAIEAAALRLCEAAGGV